MAALTVLCDGLSSGLRTDDDSTPVLTVSGSLPDGRVVEVELTQAQVAWLAVHARQLDPVTYREAYAAEQRHDDESWA